MLTELFFLAVCPFLNPLTSQRGDSGCFPLRVEVCLTQASVGIRVILALEY